MKVLFLAHSVENVGGTIRATLNTASALTDLGHSVEIGAVFRKRAEPLFKLDNRVRVWPLVDLTRRSGLITKLQSRRPSRLYPPGDTRTAQFHRLTDLRVARFLSESDADVIIGTRPGLNVYVANLAPAHAVKIGQEHLFLEHHKPELRAVLERQYCRLDAVVTVSAADAANYRHELPELADRMHFIPNSIQPTPLPPSTGDTKLIMAAGRIESPKRFDVLLKAFADVHHRHPDWRLRIYGTGSRLESLRALATRLRLGDAVSFMGQRTPLDPEWAKATIAVSTSRRESFGLTLVEAMDCGVPVVSTACPHGPPEIITDGVDGLLTPVDDVEAVTKGLCRLIEDPQLRYEMGQAARRTARDYYPRAVGRQYEQLFTDLMRRRPDRVRRQRARRKYRPYPVVRRPVVHARTIDFTEVVFSGETGLRLVNGRHKLGLPATGRITADRLDEGVWTVTCSGEPVRAGRVDSRALLRGDTDMDGPEAVMVPFSDGDELRLRVWRRPAWAEIDYVAWDGDECKIAGRLLSPRRPRDLLIRLRDDPDAKVTVPATTEPDGRFRATVPAGLLNRPDDAPGLRHWDLWLTGDDTDIRLGRFFDDIAKRKSVQRFATVTTNDRRIEPYFTVHNELSIRVRNGEEALGGVTGSRRHQEP
ncbi:glycosyltransferase involved in cell wall biosynthesis [Stackebrandtia endophytica]|uniref:Glycosyltransferase involved in cell wall biosynthesis n=1 Tax=Stackebrandtia endophytica TaxID=1496996 RepID=A0A543AVL3_9ACTN|nr:glycosyltransferase family 4 protein [Stackebrandtia endophytica]TQL76572.1 glycosyltransferase involved in cell wall biosynthesis [Stackebrandtia endophytica]